MRKKRFMNVSQNFIRQPSKICITKLLKSLYSTAHCPFRLTPYNTSPSTDYSMGFDACFCVVALWVKFGGGVDRCFAHCRGSLLEPGRLYGGLGIEKNQKYLIKTQDFTIFGHQNPVSGSGTLELSSDASKKAFTSLLKVSR